MACLFCCPGYVKGLKGTTAACSGSRIRSDASAPTASSRAVEHASTLQTAPRWRRTAARPPQHRARTPHRSKVLVNLRLGSRCWSRRKEDNKD
ncbi:hypothetical protein BDA96_02G149100 [Sorghum bicolor]|uniref:Uncharacterized protein n=2 Tax=Sorghum bicolor TaxID=4558 RepID=A0A1B6QB74_SORBI|nr:hypothetical protein BDA96_02G149100 [Sorghum bicolor]KXG35175.1 hypothetical protein SORBI_3002G143100 [Sorghum bicolor]